MAVGMYDMCIHNQCVMVRRRCANEIVRCAVVVVFAGGGEGGRNKTMFIRKEAFRPDFTTGDREGWMTRWHISSRRDVA